MKTGKQIFLEFLLCGMPRKLESKILSVLIAENLISSYIIAKGQERESLILNPLHISQGPALN